MRLALLQPDATASVSSYVVPSEQGRPAISDASSAKLVARAVSPVPTAAQTCRETTSPRDEAILATSSAAATPVAASPASAVADAAHAQRRVFSLMAELRSPFAAFIVSPTKQAVQTAIAIMADGYVFGEAAISTGYPSRYPTTVANAAAETVEIRPTRVEATVSSPSSVAEAHEAVAATSPKMAEAPAGRSSYVRTQQGCLAVLPRPSAAQDCVQTAR